MKFFLDTADISEIKTGISWGIVDGVTTNPSLYAKVGGSYEELLKEICGLTKGPVSAEVISDDVDGMVKEGLAFAKIAANIVVKVPMIKDGVRAIKYFSDRGIRTNCTLIFSAGQAILAAKAGATYLSPFIGRIDDQNWEGMDLIKQIAEIYAVQGYDTEILAASVRTSLHIVQCAQNGADVVTCPLSAILGLLKHPLTDIGLAQFLADHAKGSK